DIDRSGLATAPPRVLPAVPARRSSDLKLGPPLVRLQRVELTVAVVVKCPADRLGRLTPRGPCLDHEFRLQSPDEPGDQLGHLNLDRKSTRLNSSHVKTSYAVFCLKRKT